MRLSLALFLVMLNTTLRADPGTVAKQVRAWRTNHEREILAEFAQLLSIPNLANDTPNIRRNADAIRKMCEKRGLVAKLVTIEGAPPVIVADFAVPNAKRTVAFYAHYDGQPVDASQWKSEPWKPVMRDNA
ncbi:MAG: M20/M25/M40 family metallo-hydrolase, partial [Candidatus Udaeobacter sp.]